MLSFAAEPLRYKSSRGRVNAGAAPYDERLVRPRRTLGRATLKRALSPRSVTISPIMRLRATPNDAPGVEVDVTRPGPRGFISISDAAAFGAISRHLL